MDYIPKIGDIVLAFGQEHAKFTVARVSEQDQTANLQMLSADHHMTNVPWRALTPIKGKTRND